MFCKLPYKPDTFQNDMGTFSRTKIFVFHLKSHIFSFGNVWWFSELRAHSLINLWTLRKLSDSPDILRDDLRTFEKCCFIIFVTFQILYLQLPHLLHELLDAPSQFGIIFGVLTKPIDSLELIGNDLGWISKIFLSWCSVIFRPSFWLLGQTLNIKKQ